MNIIIIGFKNVGKTVVGKALANRLNKPFLDLDEAITEHSSLRGACDEAIQIDLKPSIELDCFASLAKTSFVETSAELTPRQIMTLHGAEYFRSLEHQVFQQIMPTTPTIMALGGGTPLNIENRVLMQSHIVFHLTAPKNKVFKRIMAADIPAFFCANQTPRDSFNTLWNERKMIYQQLANFTVENNSSIEESVAKMIQYLPNEFNHASNS